MNSATQLKIASIQPTSIHKMAVQVGMEQIKAIFAEIQQMDDLEMELDFDEIQSIFDFELLSFHTPSHTWVTEFKSPEICLDDPRAITQLQEVITAANALIHPNVLNFPAPALANTAVLQTSQGHMFDLLAPERSTIDINDIAHHLSNLCRFNGATHQHYSVAQHSVLVSKIVPQCLALPALLHDAAEAYVGDLPSPLKALLPDYQIIESNIMRCIFEQVGLEYPYHSEIKRADRVALATEARDLLAPISEAKLWTTPNGISPCAITITPLSQEDAETEFLARYFELQTQAAAAVPA